jgi:hypothetical protein
MPIQALHHIRPMRGRMKSHLMYCHDGEAYIVKFRNNPVHRRLLACDYLATMLGIYVGLPLPDCDTIQVPSFLMRHTEELSGMVGDDEYGDSLWHLGSRLVGGIKSACSLMNMLPESYLLHESISGSFAGILALDTWCANCGPRQAVFSRRSEDPHYRPNFIGQSACFSGTLSNSLAPFARALYGQRAVYHWIHGWDSFEPYLTRLVSIQPAVLHGIALGIPSDWYEDQPQLLDSLIDSLLRRRTRLHEQIADVRDKAGGLFPNWQRKVFFRSAGNRKSVRMPQSSSSANVIP